MYRLILDELARWRARPVSCWGTTSSTGDAAGRRLAPDAYSSLQPRPHAGKRLELEALHGHACGSVSATLPTPMLFAVYAALSRTRGRRG